MTIDTKKVQNRRRLLFQTIEETLAEVERLNQGKVRTLGNWSAGQILRHLALGMLISLDGAPKIFPWPLRLLGRVLKKPMLKNILTKGMQPGIRLRGRAAAAFFPPETSWEEGLKHFRQAIRRLQTETNRAPSPFFGPMTREEWDQLHCRHAELHLSFLVPEGEK